MGSGDVFVDRLAQPGRAALAYATVARDQLLTRPLRQLVEPHLTGPDPDAVTHERPVVLVHGWIARKTSWAHTIVRMHRMGLVDVHTATYNVFGDDVPQAAGRLAGRIRRLADSHGVDRVDVVGHSMGGLAVLHAALHADDLPLGRVVTLGAPYLGSPLAHLSRLSPVALGPLRSARQMRPGCGYLAELRDAAARGLPAESWTCLWSPADELVPPPSGELDAPGVTSVRTPPVAHVEMLLSRRIAALTVAALAPIVPSPHAVPRRDARAAAVAS